MMQREAAFEGLPDDDPFPPMDNISGEQLEQVVARLESAEQILRAVGEPEDVAA
jgi:hypothetical protein